MVAVLFAKGALMSTSGGMWRVCAKLASLREFPARRAQVECEGRRSVPRRQPSRPKEGQCRAKPRFVCVCCLPPVRLSCVCSVSVVSRQFVAPAEERDAEERHGPGHAQRQGEGGGNRKRTSQQQARGWRTRGRAGAGVLETRRPTPRVLVGGDEIISFVLSTQGAHVRTSEEERQERCACPVPRGSGAYEAEEAMLRAGYDGGGAAGRGLYGPATADASCAGFGPKCIPPISCCHCSLRRLSRRPHGRCASARCRFACLSSARCVSR
jgi:hypothetical protein